MSQQPKTKNCQNCKKDFIIESEDFNFYEKIKVPPPTFCPECRRQRRFAWRNERSLYKRICDLCQKNIISMYPKETTFPVYCRECWYSDDWDATSYGRDYDFSKSFFEQFRELSKVVPRMGIFQRNAINSKFSNMVGESKNVYLSISVILGSENIFYSWCVDKSFNIFDSYSIKESDSCYEDMEGEKNYNTQNTLFCRNCLDSKFLIDCVNCNNCFMSFNFRNKEFYIRNEQYSKEDYFNIIKKINFTSRSTRIGFIKEFEAMKRKTIFRYANNIKTINSSGNNLENVKNCRDCFYVYNTEDAKYCYRVIPGKDCMDMDYGGKSELMYEYNTGSWNDYNIKFTYSAFDNVQNAEYVESCIASKNLFGCISVKSKKNVILNKVYSKDEFIKLREKIINQMIEVPYKDKKGRIYKYGEFFPIELSAFAYNESLAQAFWPLPKEKILEEGYLWHEPEKKEYQITIPTENIPDDIKKVNEEILNEILECAHKENCDHHRTKTFRLTKDEFNFYQKHDIPIPSKCYNCRHYERFEKALPLKLWCRKCMKEGCPNEFETSYAPERPEIVYCERCYQQEVY
jgi:hypothetical protein